MRKPNFKQPTRELLLKLIEKSAKEKQGIWRAISEKLSTPRRRRVSINLSRISLLAERLKITENEIIVVPGKVLGSGTINRPLTVAAFEFSGSAAKKLGETKGTAMSLEQLLEGKIAPDKMRLIT